MTRQRYEISRLSGYLSLDWEGKLTHYGIVIFLIIISLSSFVFIITEFFGIKPGTGVRTINDILTIGLIFFLLATLFYIVQRSRLKFKIANTKLSRDKINELIEETAKELEWDFYIVEENFIVAKTYPSFWTGSWGEQITIILDKDRIMVNSICDPDKKSSVVSMGRNKKNENKLIEKIKNADTAL